MKSLRSFTIVAAAVALMLALGQPAPASLVQSANLGTALNPIYTFTSNDGLTASGSWTVPSYITDTFKVLVVAGGGGGGFKWGGGGGAGGLIYNATLNPSGTITITIGGGGAGSSTQKHSGDNGGNSVFHSLTAIGGGGGAGELGPAAGAGGSGGGGARSASPGSGTSGQGNNGGAGASGGVGGGGGGAGEVGNADGTGAGGDGLYYGDVFYKSTEGDLDLGDDDYFAGGGGGGYTGAARSGGQGGGGVGGGTGSPSPGGDGLANTGGGGGGGGAAYGPYYGGDGGSGIVVVTYTAPAATFTSTATGTWDTVPTDPWDQSGVIPAAYNPVIVTGGFTVTADDTGSEGKSLSITANSAVTVNAGGTLTIGEGVSVESGSTLDVDGTLNVTTGGVSIAGTLSGGGLVEANVEMNGWMQPGDSIGTLSVDGNLTVGSAKRYDWEVGATTSDLVEVDGLLDLDDGWILKIIDAGGDGAAGDYKLFTYTTIDFDPDEVLYDLDDVGSLGWTEDMLSLINVPGGSGSVYLHVMAEPNRIPEPSSVTLWTLGALLLCCVAWRRRRK